MLNALNAVWRGVVWCGVAWRGVAWRGVVWCGGCLCVRTHSTRIYVLREIFGQPINKLFRTIYAYNVSRNFFKFEKFKILELDQVNGGFFDRVFVAAVVTQIL